MAESKSPTAALDERKPMRLHKLEVEHLTFVPQDAYPASPVKGTVVLLKSMEKLQYYTGSKWISLP